MANYLFYSVFMANYPFVKYFRANLLHVSKKLNVSEAKHHGLRERFSLFFAPLVVVGQFLTKILFKVVRKKNEKTWRLHFLSSIDQRHQFMGCQL